jgi:hypothetical protein
MFELNIDIIKARPEDTLFVINSWATSQTSDIIRRIQKSQDDVAQRHKYKVNESLLWASNMTLAQSVLRDASVLVAVDPANHEQTYGYVVYDDDLLLWIYTKIDYRNTHVATNLMRRAFPGFKNKPIAITTTTYSISHYKDKWNLELDFDAIKGFIK